MASMRQRRIIYLEHNGFLPSEAIQLSRTSRQGLLAPYFQFWIRSRRRLFDNAQRYKWTDQQYRDYIKQQYTDAGAIKQNILGQRLVDVWAMLRFYEEKAHRRGEEYESPWRKRLQRKSSRKQQTKRVTRKEAVKSWIEQLDRNIARASSEQRKQQFREQKLRLQKQLESMS